MSEKNAALKSNFVSMICLLIFIFLYCGWKIGLVAFLFVFCIECFFEWHARGIKKEIDNQFNSGAKPYTCYFKSDNQGIFYKIIFDETLSPIAFGDNIPDFIIFMTEEEKEGVLKKVPKTNISTSNNFTNIKNYYEDIKKKYYHCAFSIENIEIIRSILESKDI